MSRVCEILDLANKQEMSCAVYMVSAKGNYYNMTLSMQILTDDAAIYEQLKRVLPESDNIIEALAWFLVPGLTLELPSYAFTSALIRLNDLNTKTIIYSNGLVWRPLSELEAEL